MKFLNAVRSISDRIYAARNPVGFARHLGVDVADSVRFYGVSRAMFGSEPWLIRIHENCYITSGVNFITHDGGTLILRNEIPTLEWTAPIEIKRSVYVGFRSIILPNVTIGERSIVGAGSVVTKNVPPNSVVAGVPARLICDTDTYLKKMKAKSLGCGHHYGDEKAKIIRKIYYDRGWFN